MNKSKAGKGNRTIGVIVSEETYETLKVWAEEKDWSVSQAARNLIEKGLSDQTDSSPKK
jgi:hypothetical protein